MGKFKIQSEKFDTLQLPDNCGYFYFKNGDKTLFVKKTANINRFVRYYLDKANTDPVIQEMASKVTDIFWDETPLLLSAYIQEQIIIAEQRPEYQSQIKPYEDYAYLAIDWNKVPYVKVTEDTAGDAFYIGPFRDRFFISDLIYTFADIGKLPACDSENYPCERLTKETCMAYCTRDFDHMLPRLLESYYVFPNETLLPTLHERYEFLMDELEFSEGDVIKAQIRIFEKYYENLLFLYVTRKIDLILELDGFTLTIKSGLLKHIQKDDKIWFANSQEDIEFRDNEFLAIDKQELDNRWIIWQFVRTNQPVWTDEQYYLQINHLKDILRN